jgi:hypothetical protein
LAAYYVSAVEGTMNGTIIDPTGGDTLTQKRAASAFLAAMKSHEENATVMRTRGAP